MKPSIFTSTLAFADQKYVVTEEDILWLARAVEKECLDDADDLDERRVAQALVNCFCLEASRGVYKNLKTFVQAYAQPVNPRWFPEGDLFKKWHAIDPKKYPLSAAVARRDKHSKRSDFGWEACAAVDRALIEGPVDILPSCTDYAAAWLDASKKYVELTKPEKGRNRLWTRAPWWTGYEVFEWQIRV